MRLILSIITFSISICSYGQKFSNVAVSVLSKEQRISKVLSNPKFIKNKTLISYYNVDSIDFDVVIYSDLFENKKKKGKTLIKEPEYEIVVYTIHDSIFYKKITKIKYYEDSGKLKTELIPVFSIIDTPRLLSFISRHNLKYNSLWTLQEFLQKPNDYGPIGFFCGIVGAPTEHTYSLARMIKSIDTISLKNMASSFSPQERTLGATGLYFLKRKGIQLSEEMKELIETNQKFKFKIMFCGGCIISNYSVESILEISQLNELYETFVFHNLL